MKTNDELSHVKRDLNYTTNALKGFILFIEELVKYFVNLKVKAFNYHPGTEKELKITKIESEKTKSNLSKNVDHLSKTLNGIFFILLESNKKSFLLKLGTENELAKLQMRTGNLSIELKSKAEIELFFFQIELNCFFIFIA